MKKFTIVEHLYKHIREVGVKTIFGVPGDFSLAMLDILESSNALRWIGCATELGAAYCADGYARANGLGVVLTTFGVGELSAATAIAGSTAEDVGVLHIVATPPTNALNVGSPLHHSFADGDLQRFQRVAQEIHNKTFTVTENNPLKTIKEAIHYWRTKASTTYIMLPQDIAVKESDNDFLPTPPLYEHISPNASKLISEFINKYPNAIAILGNVAQRRGVRELTPGLAEKNIPVAVLPNAKGIVNETDSNYIGIYNGKLSSPSLKNRAEGPSGRVLIGCTLADTTTGGLSHIFSSKNTLIIDAHTVSWNSRFENAPIKQAFIHWLSCSTPFAEEHATHHKESERFSKIDPQAALTQKSMWTILTQKMPEHVRIFAETGSPHYGALDSIFANDTVFECASIWSAIGYALPASLGASLSESTRRVVSVIGDGAAQMTANEFGLVDRYGANPVILILDNDGYTVERIIRGEKAAYNDVAQWQWRQLPATLGAKSARTTVCINSASFAESLSEAFKDESRAHVIIVPLDKYDATTSLLTMGKFLRAKAKLPSLEQSLSEG